MQLLNSQQAPILLPPMEGLLNIARADYPLRNSQLGGLLRRLAMTYGSAPQWPALPAPRGAPGPSLPVLPGGLPGPLPAPGAAPAMIAAAAMPAPVPFAGLPGSGAGRRDGTPPHMPPPAGSHMSTPGPAAFPPGGPLKPTAGLPDVAGARPPGAAPASGREALRGSSFMQHLAGLAPRNDAGAGPFNGAVTEFPTPEGLPPLAPPSMVGLRPYRGGNRRGAEAAVLRLQDQELAERQQDLRHEIQRIVDHGWKHQNPIISGKHASADQKEERTRSVATKTEGKETFLSPEHAAWAWKERVARVGGYKKKFEASALIYQIGPNQYRLTETITQDYNDAVYPWELKKRPGNIVGAVHNHPIGGSLSPRPLPGGVVPRPIFSGDDRDMARKRKALMFVTDPSGNLVRWDPRRDDDRRFRTDDEIPFGWYGTQITRKELNAIEKRLRGSK